MTMRELLYFAGSILGPALIAQAVLELLQEVQRPTAAGEARRPQTENVDRLLATVFPRGLEL